MDGNAAVSARENPSAAQGRDTAHRRRIESEMAIDARTFGADAYTPSGVVEFGQEANRPGDATNAPGHDTEEVTSMPDQLTRGPRFDSRRFFHERTGEPMPAYVVGEFVIEKARRDWDARPFRGSAGNPTKREWWEVRRQGSNAHSGCSVGRNPLFVGDTLMECLAWIGEQP